MNPLDFMKPPPGAPDDPTAMGAALSKRPMADIFNSTPGVPPSDGAGAMFDEMGNQILDYDPNQYSLEYANGGEENNIQANDPDSDREALEQAYLQRAQQERDVSRGAQDKTASSNEEQEMESRRKMGL